jgi:hypothetical protein
MGMKISETKNSNDMIRPLQSFVMVICQSKWDETPALIALNLSFGQILRNTCTKCITKHA